MNKSNEELNREISRHESLVDWGAWAIIAGLGGEIAFALLSLFVVELGPVVDRWVGIGANALIAFGVWVEIHWGGKANRAHKALQERAEQGLAAALDRASAAVVQAGEANARAAEAELQTEILRKEMAWRRLSAQQSEKISEILGRQGVAKFGLRIMHPSNDPEATTFARDIAAVFRLNGWPVLFVEQTGTTSLTGMMIPLYGPPDFDACGIVRLAVSNAGIEYIGGAPGPFSGMSAASGDNISGPHGDMYIGARPPPKLG